MDLNELSTLLDGKLDPIRASVTRIEAQLFGNGRQGLCERVAVLERDGTDRRDSKKWRWDLIIAMGGWAVTLIVWYAK